MKAWARAVAVLVVFAAGCALAVFVGAPDAAPTASDSGTVGQSIPPTISGGETIPPTISGGETIPPNTAPTAADDSYSAAANLPLTVPAPGILNNDTDPDGDAMTASLVSGPAHADSFTSNADGSFAYTPVAGYAGPDAFTYKANDGQADSNIATVSIAVINYAPTAVSANGQCSPTNMASGTIDLALGDPNGDDVTLTLASNSNTSLVPNANVIFGGFAYSRTVTVTGAPKKKGTAVLTFNVSDGTNTLQVVVTVKIGTDNAETINGTSGIDMILGLAGRNTLNGNAGNDLLCGGNAGDVLNGGDGNDTLDGEKGDDSLSAGDRNDRLRGSNGNDTLAGGAGGDSFSGGPGLDVATDFSAAEGDIQDGTIP